MAPDFWNDVFQERGALMELLDTLTPEEWDTGSLCTEWRVRDVVGHMVSETNMSVVDLAVGTVASGFRVNRFIARDARRRGNAPVKETLDDFRAMLTSRKHLPGLSSLAMLEDIVVHQLDIRRPLQRSRSVPGRRMIAVASDLWESRFFPGQNLFHGLHATASDSDWSKGEGAEVVGPIEALVLTLSGRMVAIDELQGDGLPELRHRVSRIESER